MQEQQTTQQDDDLENQVKQMENKLKAQHSKNAIFLFVVFGVILFIFNKEPLFSLTSLLFFVMGIFLASFLSIPSYLLKMYISKKINVKQALTMKRFYWIIEFGYDFIVTFLLFKIFVFIF